MNDMFGEKASKGGKVRAGRLTSDQRKLIAQKGALARWEKAKEITEKEPIAIHPYTRMSVLRIGSIEFPCAVLENRIPIIAYTSVTRTLGRGTGGKTKRLAKAVKGTPLPDFLSGSTLEPFVPESLRMALNNPITFRAKGGIRKGLNANIIPEICGVWIDAHNADALQPTQDHIWKNADRLLRGFASVGITALVYEATGYDKIKDRDDLERILEAYVTKEWLPLLPWTKRFPDDFYEQLFRLKDWEYRPLSVKRPKLVGKLTSELIYEKLPKGVLDELRNKNPVTPRGYRRYKLFQFLTEDIGNPHLEKQIAAVTTLMKASTNWATFNRLFNRVFGNQKEMIFPELEGKG